MKKKKGIYNIFLWSSSRRKKNEKKMMSKKRRKKKQCKKAGWATAHFPALCHDTMYCIVIGKGIGAQGCAARPYDTAGEGLRYGRDRP